MTINIFRTFDAITVVSTYFSIRLSVMSYLQKPDQKPRIPDHFVEVSELALPTVEELRKDILACLTELRGHAQVNHEMASSYARDPAFKLPIKDAYPWLLEFCQTTEHYLQWVYIPSVREWLSSEIQSRMAQQRRYWSQFCDSSCAYRNGHTSAHCKRPHRVHILLKSIFIWYQELCTLVPIRDVAWSLPLWQGFK